ncbi:MAG: hypothetical protein KAR38_13200 [Calditrichia bacterium]|nr:hypothetical protein [Calditrichia bacterium]
MRKNLVFAFIMILIFTISAFKIVQAEGNEESAFRLSFGAKYLSRFTAYGIDLAGENPAWGLNSSLSHKSGFYSDVYFTRPAKTPYESQQFTFDVGYEKEVSSRFTMSGEFSQFLVSSDTVNLLSQFSNMISVNAEFNLKNFDFGLSYDRFLGSSGANYFSLDISTFHDLGHVYILPILQVVFMSQSVDESFMVKGKGKHNINKTAVTSDLTGIANTILTVVTIFPVLKNVSLSFVPSLILNHQDELSAESSQLVWNAGISYNFNFLKKTKH